MGHYGLIREQGKPVEHRHSWDNDNLFTSWFFIEIGRQCDHHVRGETYFWELDDVKGPNYGIGYFSLFVLTLIPSLLENLFKNISIIGITTMLQKLRKILSMTFIHL